MPRAFSSPYIAAANLLTEIWNGKSLKNLVYSKDGALKCSKATYAQVCQVLSNKPLLDNIVDQVPAFQTDIYNRALLYVLVFELLLGPNKSIRGGGALKRKIVKQETRLRDVLKEVQPLHKTQNGHKRRPRYARVNTLLLSMEEVARVFQKESRGGAEVDNKEEDEDDDKETLECYVDPHVPNLLVFSPSMLARTMQQDDLKRSSLLHTIKGWIQSGKLILQDKSSCFTAMCLFDNCGGEDTLGGDYLDACAAPGNKTSHLATLIGSSNYKQKRTVYAIDRSNERLASLEKRMAQMVPSNHQVRVVPKQADFLQTDVKDYESVTSILLDPSCSGSGIFTAPDRWNEADDNDKNDDDAADKRVESLSNFQLMALLHAMSFPNVSRIAYSTCSIHDQENELVIAKALAESNGDWKVVAPQCLRHWKRRGKTIEGLTEDQAKAMIRVDQEDGTNGFFVCCLEKTTKSTQPIKNGGSAQNSSVINVPEGMNVYAGQFSGRKSENKSIKDKADMRRKQVAKDGKGTPLKERVKKGDSTSKSIIHQKAPSSKQEKKRAWKKRQQELKLERIERQKKRVKTPIDQEKA